MRLGLFLLFIILKETMKKLLIAGAVILFGLSDAQIKTGTLYLSGRADFSQEKNNNTEIKNQDFSITPTVGVFVAPNLAIGTGIGYAENRREYIDIFSWVSYEYTKYKSVIKMNAFIAAPFIRKYWTLSDNLYFFGQLEAPIQIGKRTVEVQKDHTTMVGTYSQYTSNEQKYTSFGVNVKPGVDYFISKNWTIEATIGEFGYNNMKIKDQEKGTDDLNFGLNLSSVTFGVKYVFAK